MYGGFVIYQAVEFTENPYAWTDGGASVATGVVEISLRADDDNATLLRVNNLPTPIDIYIHIDTSLMDLSYLPSALITRGATTLFSVNTERGLEVAIKVMLKVNNSLAGKM